MSDPNNITKFMAWMDLYYEGDNEELLHARTTENGERCFECFVPVIEKQISGVDKNHEKAFDKFFNNFAKEVDEYVSKLKTDKYTLEDVITSLKKPNLDPRDEMPKPVLRADVLKFEDLREGQILTGTVRNVIDFGAFVDIGVHQDGLVHISRMSDKYIRHPAEVVKVGDVVKVWVVSVDEKKKRIALTMVKDKIS